MGRLQKFQVTILKEDFEVEAENPGQARRKAAKLYVEKFGKKFPVEALVAFTRLRRLNPKKPGRKPIYEW